MSRLFCRIVCVASLVVASAGLASSALAQSTRPADTGWHGRAIRHVLRDGANLELPGRFPRGWAAGRVRLGTGSHRAGGSERVREVQRRLWALGYRPGPVDGIFGARTKAAVEWLQIKHGLRPSGVVSLATLVVLRGRTTSRTAPAPRVRAAEPASRASVPRPAPEPVAPPISGSAQRQWLAGGDPSGPPLWLVAALAALLFTGLQLWTIARGQRRTSPPKPCPAAPRPIAAAAPAPAPRQVRALASENGNRSEPVITKLRVANRNGGRHHPRADLASDRGDPG